MTRTEFDYIIAGGGLAGLSLARHLSESSLAGRRVLVIDRDPKDRNDRTWCFWEKGESVFEEIVRHRWDRLRFHGTGGFERSLDLGAYRYKMIRSLDLYRFVRERLEPNPSYTFLQAEIEGVEGRTVVTGRGRFEASEYVFDSFTRKTYDRPDHTNLLQHFLGWEIATERAVFDPQEPTLFDFRVPQRKECRFVYILPFAPDRALVEFTVFSPAPLERAEYEENLREYISERLRPGGFRIEATEHGVIPMSDEPHEEFPRPGLVRIGTAGGYVKPSTGYSFRRTQTRLRELVAALEAGRPLAATSGPARRREWKRFLDSVLLDVLAAGRHPAAEVFTELFRRNPPPRMLRFLDEETSFREDLAVMRTVPLRPFSAAAVRTFLKSGA